MDSKCSLNVFLCSVTCLVVVASLFSPIGSAWGSSATLDVYPDSIKFKIDQEKNPMPYVLQITSDQNATKVHAYFSDLRTEDDGGLLISNKVFTMSPEVFNLTSGEIKTIMISMQLGHKSPGVYNGRMVLSGSNSTSLGIPITVTVNEFEVTLESHPLMPLGIVTAGVGTSFLVNFLKIGIKRREDALDSMTKAYRSLQTAGSENRASLRELELGKDAFKDGKDAFEHGDYVGATSYFDEAKEFWDKMKTDQLLIQLPEAWARALYQQAKQVSPLFRGLFKASDNLYYLLIAIVLVATILATWQGVSEEIFKFKNGLADGIASFMLGFGSQTLLQQVVPLLKRQWE